MKTPMRGAARANAPESERPPAVGGVALLRRWGPRVLGVALFALVLVSVGPGRVWASLRTANLWLLTPALLLVVPFIATKAWRWAGLAADLALPDLSRWDAFRFYAIGLFAGQATPGQAGDFLKAWYLRSRGAALAPALLSCLLDRLFDIAMLLGLGALALFAYAGGGQSIVLVVLALLAVVVVIALVLTERWRKPVFAALARITPAVIRNRLAANDSLRALAEARLSARQLAPALGWTAVSWMLSLGRVWLCFVALGVHLPLTDFLVATILQGLAALVSIAGLGTRDVVLLTFLARYGYNGGTAVALSFLILIVNMSNVVPGFLVWFRAPVPLRRPIAGDEPQARRAPLTAGAGER
ncbi:MAG: lysylphosphatidylglycerol synthase transmembrane domain-containing protein [Thermomicrobiales bacterium]